MRRSPCKDCKKRAPTCKDYCTDWQEFEKNKDLKYAQRRRAALENYPQQKRDGWGMKRSRG